MQIKIESNRLSLDPFWRKMMLFVLWFPDFQTTIQLFVIGMILLFYLYRLI